MKSLKKVNSASRTSTASVAAIQGELAAQLAGYGSAPLPAGPIQPGNGSGLIWPVNGPVVSGFGYRWGRMHEGIDIAVPAGTPIRAAASGSVVLQQGEAESGGYGNFTCLDHGGGLQTCYAHQSAVAVELGSECLPGDVIGYVGCTGHCFGDHLHFEVRVNGAPDRSARLPLGDEARNYRGRRRRKSQYSVVAAKCGAATLGSGKRSRSMIRQAHTYLAGAVSGTALIAAAVAIFVILVSVQAARDWPFRGLVGDGGETASSRQAGPGKPAHGAGPARAASGGGTTKAAKAAGGGGGGSTGSPGGTGLDAPESATSPGRWRAGRVGERRRLDDEDGRIGWRQDRVDRAARDRVELWVRRRRWRFGNARRHDRRRRRHAPTARPAGRSAKPGPAAWSKKP